MKLKYAVLPTALALLFSAASFAKDTGTIYFTGTINASTCKVNDGNKDSYIDMGTHDTSVFNVVGKEVRGTQNVILNLTECTGAKANLALTAKNRIGVNQIKLKQNAATAKGLAIVLKDKTTNDVRRVDGYITPKTIKNGKAKFEYVPYLVSTAKVVSAGAIDASVDYTITYN
ncbi:fimbrial protein [Morganella morganii]|uniref:fimbrial protein n=1 Tax=Morganella morganii TaxID=582 RepID=UPI003D7F27DF